MSLSPGKAPNPRDNCYSQLILLSNYHAPGTAGILAILYVIYHNNTVKWVFSSPFYNYRGRTWKTDDLAQ